MFQDRVLGDLTIGTDVSGRAIGVSMCQDGRERQVGGASPAWTLPRRRSGAKRRTRGCRPRSNPTGARSQFGIEIMRANRSPAKFRVERAHSA